jgi:hypothetical protein
MSRADGGQQLPAESDWQPDWTRKPTPPIEANRPFWSKVSRSDSNRPRYLIFSARKERADSPTGAGAPMNDDLGTAELSPATNESSRSTSAARMRRHRERQRQHLRCLTIELKEGEIEGLIQRGWLARDRRTDGPAIRTALYHYLDDNLGDAQWPRPKPRGDAQRTNRSQK